MWESRGKLRGQSTHSVPIPRVCTPPCALVISKESLSSHFHRVRSMRPTCIRRLQVKGDTVGWPNTAMASDPIIIWYLRRYIYENHTSTVMNLISLVYLFGAIVTDRATMSRSCLNYLHRGCQDFPSAYNVLSAPNTSKLISCYSFVVHVFPSWSVYSASPFVRRKQGIVVLPLVERHNEMHNARQLSARQEAQAVADVTFSVRY